MYAVPRNHHDGAHDGWTLDMVMGSVVMMSKGGEMIHAWIKQMELEQPEYGHLLQSTVDKVGPLPAIDDIGAIYSIADDMKFWMASGFAKAYAASVVKNMQVTLMGGRYPELRAAGDEEGMIDALEKNKFYESFHAWIQSTEPLRRRMTEIPAWLAPYVGSSAS